MIYGQGRSGSTLLKELLNSHPEICCEGELLNLKDRYITHNWSLKQVKKFPLLFFSYRAIKAGSRCYGFTLLYYQYYPQEKILRKLHEKGWKIIYIRRKDIIEQSFSYLVAKKTDMWHTREYPADPIQKIRITREEFLSWTFKMRNINYLTDQMISSIPHFPVFYETDLQSKDNWPETTQRIFRHLGIQPASVSASIKKTYAQPYSEIIENYDELVKALSSGETP